MNTINVTEVARFIEKTDCIYYVTTDMNGNYTYANGHFFEKFSFLGDVIGKPFSESVHPEDVGKCNEAAYRCIINPDDVVVVLVRKPTEEDSFFWTSWEFSPLKDDLGNPAGIQCLGYDITDAQQLQKSVMEQAKHVAQQNQVLREVAHQQSHELRRPVANILGLIDIFEAEEGNEKNIKVIDYLKVAMQELDIIIHDIVKKVENSND